MIDSSQHASPFETICSASDRHGDLTSQRTIPHHKEIRIPMAKVRTGRFRTIFLAGVAVAVLSLSLPAVAGAQTSTRQVSPTFHGPQADTWFVNDYVSRYRYTCRTNRSEDQTWALWTWTNVQSGNSSIEVYIPPEEATANVTYILTVPGQRIRIPVTQADHSGNWVTIHRGPHAAGQIQLRLGDANTTASGDYDWCRWGGHHSIGAADARLISDPGGAVPARVTNIGFRQSEWGPLLHWKPLAGVQSYHIDARESPVDKSYVRRDIGCTVEFGECGYLFLEDRIPPQDFREAKQFRVRATNESGNGPWSSWIEVEAYPQQVVWVSSGDSYSSGTEGLPDCRRTNTSYGPTARNILDRNWDIPLHRFEACFGTVAGVYGEDQGIWSGADTTEYQEIDDDRESSVFHDEVGVLVMSFGGNDIGFSDVLKGCVFLGCRVSDAELKMRVQELGDAMTDFYVRIMRNRLSTRGRLYVVGYPSIAAPPDEWASGPFGCNFLSRSDGTILERMARELNDALKRAVEQANSQFSGTRAYYLDTLTLYRTGRLNGRDYDGEANGKHELCGTPPAEKELRENHRWMNGLVLRGLWRTWASQSFHPNEHGHSATARALADLIADTF